jgi:iron-sulfur cluster repair protein YtfE (RIC family)
MVSIAPSSIRQRILREHGALRALLSELQQQVAILPLGGAQQVQRTIALTDTLYTELMQHLDLEDLVLVPALREADAWGPVRARELVGHHATQRQELAALRHERTASLGAQQLADRLTSIIDGLHADMFHEERDLLGCLRDDVLGVDVEDG